MLPTWHILPVSFNTNQRFTVEYSDTLLGTEKVADVSGTFQRRRVRTSEVSLGKETIGSQIALWWMTGRMTETILMAFWVGGLSSGKLHLTLNTAGLRRHEDWIWVGVTA